MFLNSENVPILQKIFVFQKIFINFEKRPHILQNVLEFGRCLVCPNNFEFQKKVDQFEKYS